MRGYAWLPLRRHVIELHELTEDEGAAFMRDIRRASRAIAAATGAVKLNHEIHGSEDLVDEWVQLWLPTTDELHRAVSGSGWGVETRHTLEPYRIDRYVAAGLGGSL